MRPLPDGTAAELELVVTEAMTVRFDRLGPVHPVYATYEMARHFEEAGRLLLLPHLDDGEAAVGSAVSVEHRAPAAVGTAVRVVARCTAVDGNRVRCACTATDGRGRVLGEGTTEQVVLPRAALDRLLGGSAR